MESIEFVYCGCDCGFTRPKYDKKGRIRKCIKDHVYKGLKHPTYKGGSIDAKGYKRRFVNGKRNIPEHRYVWEQYYKVCLLKWIDVHHKDGNKLNNDITNLEVLTHGKHTILHNLKDKSDWFCLVCGSKSTYINKKGEASWTNYKDGHRCNICYLKNYRNISSYKSVDGKTPPLEKYLSNISKK